MTRSDNFAVTFVFFLALLLAATVYFVGPLSIILAAGLLLMMFALQKKRYLLMFLIFFIPIFPKVNIFGVAGSSFSVRFEDLMFAVILFFIALAVMSEKKNVKMDDLGRYLVYFIFASLVSLLFGFIQHSITFEASPVLFFIRRIEYLSFFFIGYMISDRESIRVLRASIVPVFFIVGIVAVLQRMGLVGGFFHGQYTLLGSGGRSMSTFSVPGELAAFIAIIFTYSVIAILDSALWHRVFWSIVAVLQVAVLFMTESRIELLSIPAGLIVLAMIKGMAKRAVIIFFVLLLLAGMAVPSNLRDKISAVLKPETIQTISDAATGIKRIDINKALAEQSAVAPEYDMSALVRLYFWINAYDTFRSYPVFGGGQSSAGEIVDGNYLRLLAENGIVGFVLFLFIVHYIWKRCVKVYNDPGAEKELKDFSLFVLVMLANMLVIALVMDVFEISKIAFFFWLTVGVFLKAANSAKSEAVQ